MLIWQIIGIFQFLLIIKGIDESFTEFGAQGQNVSWILLFTEIVTLGHWAGYERALCGLLYMKLNANLFA